MLDDQHSSSLHLDLLQLSYHNDGPAVRNGHAQYVIHIALVGLMCIASTHGHARSSAGLAKTLSLAACMKRAGYGP